MSTTIFYQRLADARGNSAEPATALLLHDPSEIP
jgi:hypothetical protein